MVKSVTIFTVMCLCTSEFSGHVINDQSTVAMVFGTRGMVLCVWFMWIMNFFWPVEMLSDQNVICGLSLWLFCCTLFVTCAPPGGLTPVMLHISLSLSQTNVVMSNWWHLPLCLTNPCAALQAAQQLNYLVIFLSANLYLLILAWKQ